MSLLLISLTQIMIDKFARDIVFFSSHKFLIVNQNKKDENVIFFSLLTLKFTVSPRHISVQWSC